MEKMSRIAVPRKDVDIDHFMVGDISCEAIKSLPNFNPHYAILYIHGGGYMSGGLDYARILGVKLAAATGFTTVTFAYRLSPEYAYPAAIEDGLAVWRHLTGGAIIPSHLFIAGDSAGGNLALCLTQRLISEGLSGPRELLLFSPWTDMTCSSETYKTNGSIDPVLTGEFVEEAARVYISGVGEPGDPRFSPLFGSFENFPPAYIMVGKNEILFDDSRRLRDRIIESGGSAILDVEEKGWHVYQQLPVPIASQAMKRLSAHVSENIG
ncbi:MAG: alpha/beta hydrolase [Lachnospiraceae bacterium]|nr:alpha/beta hydrolase [Lachnospiraceae bacterium]